MDFIRELLLNIEAASTGVRNGNDLLSEDMSVEAKRNLNYHLVMLVEEAGLVRSQQFKGINDHHFMELYLTWQGHEFLNSIRDPEVWSKTKEGAKKVGNFSIQFIGEIAKAYAKHVAKERLGIDF